VLFCLNLLLFWLLSQASTHVQPTMPARLRVVEDSGTAIALSTRMRQSSSPTPSVPSSKAQRTWDDVCCMVRAETLLSGTTDHHVERACLIASCSPGSSDWLNVLPFASVGLKMDNSTVRIAVELLCRAFISTGTVTTIVSCIPCARETTSGRMA